MLLRDILVGSCVFMLACGGAARDESTEEIEVAATTSGAEAVELAMGGGSTGGGGPGVTTRTATPRLSHLSPEQIMRVVRRNQAALRACYDSELVRQPNLRGRIEVAWSIARDGTVSSARIGSSTMNNARVEGCIVQQVRGWRFDQHDGGEVEVNFPFIFGSG